MSVATRFPELVPATEPPERRGRDRSDVALLVSTRADGAIAHGRMGDLPDLLDPGDLLVINVSATLPAALPGRIDCDEPVRLHLSTPLGAGRWVVEVRGADGSRRERPPLGERIGLPACGAAILRSAHRGSARLAEADLEVPGDLLAYLHRHGAPIRYADGPPRTLDELQTAFALEPGSAEMPSAGRPLTAELITALVARGVQVAPIVLHAGVSSLERDEMPFPERFRVPPETARLVNATHDWGGQVIAIGTTVVRALETAASADGARARRRRLDEPRRRARARCPRDRRPAHGLARARVLAPAHARGRRRARPARALLRRGRRSAATSATSSATRTSSFRERYSVRASTTARTSVTATPPASRRAFSPISGSSASAR